MGMVGSGTTPVPYSKVISHWFNHRRGLALGLAAVGSPIGGFITGTFWLMVGAAFLVSASFAGCLVHLASLLTDRGFSAQSAALATSLNSGGALLGRAGAGYLLDRFFAPYLAVGFFCGSALGTFLLWSGGVGGVAFVAAVLVGLGQGAELDILPYAVSRYFGLRAFGEIYGYTFAAVSLGAGVGPLLMGVGFDTMGSYGLVLGTFVVATLTAAGLMTGLGSYRVWEPAAEPVVATGVSRA